jgi:integrase
MLTDAKIIGLKGEPGKVVEYPDKLRPGLRLRVTGSGKTWIVRARMGGVVRTATLGSYGRGDGALTLAAARLAANTMIEAAKDGVIPLPQSPRRGKGDGELTVTKAAEQFIRYCTVDRRMKNPDAYRWQLDKYFLPAVGAWQIKSVAKSDIRSIIATIRDNHGLTTARRVGATVKLLFKWAAVEDLIAVDPAVSIPLPGKNVVRERTLTDIEIKALWHATDPANDPRKLNGAGRVAPHPSQYPWGPFYRLSLLLGQRRGEIATMKWSALDLAAATWAMTSDETKSERAHLVPLPPAAVDILKSLPRLADCDYSFSTTGSGPIMDFSGAKGVLDIAMADCLKATGAALQPWRLHDLRRTMSTNLAKLGVEPFVRRRVLNHALEGVDAVYDQFDYLEPKRVALNTWAKALAVIIGGAPGGGNVVPMKRRAKA